MKKIDIIIVMVLFSIQGFAQQSSVFNQYIFNPMTVNPAYAGTKQWTSINSVYSSQWTGLDGAPSTQMISIEGAPTESMGLGLQFINDRIGAQYQQSLYGSYSYILKLNNKVRLSMGLAAGISYFTLDGSKLVSETIDDAAVPLTRVNTMRFDPKFGLFLYSDRFYAGLSVTDMLGDLIEAPDGLNTAQQRHYYLTAGYVFDLGENVKYKPSFLIREDFKALTNIDITNYFLFRETFWIGATYRFGADLLTSQTLDNTLKMRDAVVFMTEWNISKSFVVGYAYTHSLTALSGWGGHEIMVDYTLPGKLDTRMKTPRYF
jgi:type IX secretion system PorP/SprF family membrane protein